MVGVVSSRSDDGDGSVVLVSCPSDLLDFVSGPNSPLALSGDSVVLLALYATAHRLTCRLTRSGV